MILSNLFRCREDKKPKEEPRREYITLVPRTEEEKTGTDDEDFDPLDEVLLEEDIEGEPENKAYDDWIKISERNQKINDIRFYIGVIAIGIAIVSAIIFIGRLIIYPFIHKIAKDCDW